MIILEIVRVRVGPTGDATSTRACEKSLILPLMSLDDRYSFRLFGSFV